MMRAAAALSTAPETTLAAVETARAISADLGDGPLDFCVVFVTEHHRDRLQDLLETLKLALGTPYVVGGSGAGVIGCGREIEDGPAVVVLAVASDCIQATPFGLAPSAADRGAEAGRRIGERLIRSRQTEDLVLLWSDPRRCDPGRVVQGIESVLGVVPCVGGASAVASGKDDTFQFCGEDCLDAAVAGLRIGGRFTMRIAVTRGFRPVGVPIRVTSAHQNLLMELDGRPAYHVLRDQVPKNLLGGEAQLRGTVFVGQLVGDRIPQDADLPFTLRPILEADPGAGVVAVTDPIEEGQTIVFAVQDPRVAREHLASQLRRLKPSETGRSYRFGLYFNCVARGRRLYGDPDVDIGMLQTALPDVPIVGFFGNAELGPVQGKNETLIYSGVLVLIGE